jgi:hypothetical protein
MPSSFNETFLFLTRLAWKNRVTLPIFITIAFLACNFRWEVEISIQTERIAFQPDNDRGNQPDADDEEEDNNSGTWELGDEYEIDSSNSSIVSDTDTEANTINSNF